MKKRLLALWLLGTAVAAQETTGYSDAIAAKVNGKLITTYDVMELSWREEERLRATEQDGEKLKQGLLALRRKALDRLIEEELILDRFRQTHAEVPATLLEERLQKIIADRAGGDMRKFLLDLEKNQMTMEDFRDKIRDHIAVDLMMYEFVRKKIVVTPSDIRAHYEKNAAAFTQAGASHLQVVMVSSEGRNPALLEERCEEVRQSLERGQDFMAVAERFSEIPGDLGWMVESDIRKDFLATVRELKVGEWRQVRAGGAVFFLRLAGQRPGATRSLESAFEEIRKKLEAEQEQRFREAFLEELKAQAKIELAGG